MTIILSDVYGEGNVNKQFKLIMTMMIPQDKVAKLNRKYFC